MYKKKIYIDTENINTYEWLETLEILPKDELILVTSKNTLNISVKNMFKIINSGINVIEEESITGTPNLLDMHLLSIIFMDIGSCLYSGNEYIIVSKDNAFSKIVNVMRKRIPQDSNIKINIINPTNRSTDIKINELEIAISDYEIYLEFKEKYKTLQSIHQNLKNEYGETGVEIYRKYKNLK